MTNVIQLSEVRRERTALETSSADTQICLELARNYSPKVRPQVLEAIVNQLDHPELVRQELRKMGEAI